MRTDVPLKVLTMTRGCDLLPFLGLPDSRLIKVESIELPDVAKRVDTLLHLVSPQGQKYIHFLDWHGWFDRSVLWRFASYLSLYGQKNPGKTITGTLVYLTPTYDMGDAIEQLIDDIVVLRWPIHCIRLWEEPAWKAIAAGTPGLAVLSALMKGATEEMVEHAVEIVRTNTEPPEQNNLLTILGTFSCKIMDPARYKRLTRRNVLMESTMWTDFFKEEIEEAIEKNVALRIQQREQEFKRLEEEFARMRQQEEELRRQQEEELARMRQQEEELRNTVEYTLMTRFPLAPVTLLSTLREFNNPIEYTALIRYLVSAKDLHEFEARVQEMRTRSQN